jgi:DNA helicase IV
LYELDGLVLLSLKNARELLFKRQLGLDPQGQLPSYLSVIASNFHNQVLVDEATDFSPLQLSAMYHLTSLNTQSFFACGDLNQRITSIGIRTTEQLSWISDGLEVRHVTTVYRQSRILNDMARTLLELTTGDLEAGAKLPDGESFEGAAPILLEQAGTPEKVSKWLTEAIIAIERQLGMVPTIAVLVNDEEQVIELANFLNQDLEDYGIKADPCLAGRTLGDGGNVRVFAVEHIKGLEFEAVFFVDVDKLAEAKPDVFDKFVYVGLTRAATYLGITCTQELPEPLAQLRSRFESMWS